MENNHSTEIIETCDESVGVVQHDLRNVFDITPKYLESTHDARDKKDAHTGHSAVSVIKTIELILCHSQRRCCATENPTKTLNGQKKEREREQLSTSSHKSQKHCFE